jgi:hypothetical protein
MKGRVGYLNWHLLLLLALFVWLCDGWAYAGSMRLPVTGQTVCQDTGGNTVNCSATGQDGELRKGDSWPTPRFSPSGEGAVSDHLTGLIWMRDANLITTRDREFDHDGAVNDGAVTWQHALGYVKKLNDEEYLGYNDWRLPNIREIKSLIHYASASPSAWLKETEQGFVNVQDGLYWSSTTSALSCSMAWTAAFLIGSLNVADKDETHFFVWPVRGNKSGTTAIPVTGQQTCWNSVGGEIGCKFPAPSRQDGDLQMGEPWPSPRFIVINRTVVDGLTNLHWTRDADALSPAACSLEIVTSWQQALDQVRCLNQNRYLGYSDWRLPNIHELESLVSYEVNSPLESGEVLFVSEWLASQGFTDVKPFYYWSSSSVVGDPQYVWSMNLYAGYLEPIVKSGTCYLWPVRDAFSVLGDVNDDKRVDLADAVLVMQVLTRIKNDGIVSNYPLSGSDLGGNSRIGMEDAIYVIQSAAEIR